MACWSCAARPNHRWRALVTPAKRGRDGKPISNAEVPSPAERHATMTLAQRLKRVFSIDIEVCGLCGGAVRVIACIEDQGITTHYSAPELEELLEAANKVCEEKSGKSPALVMLKQKRLTRDALTV